MPGASSKRNTRDFRETRDRLQARTTKSLASTQKKFSPRSPKPLARAGDRAEFGPGEVRGDEKTGVEASFNPGLEERFARYSESTTRALRSVPRRKPAPAFCFWSTPPLNFRALPPAGSTTEPVKRPVD